MCLGYGFAFSFLLSAPLSQLALCFGFQAAVWLLQDSWCSFFREQDATFLTHLGFASECFVAVFVVGLFPRVDSEATLLALVVLQFAVNLLALAQGTHVGICMRLVCAELPRACCCRACAGPPTVSVQLCLF